MFISGSRDCITEPTNMLGYALSYLTLAGTIDFLDATCYAPVAVVDGMSHYQFIDTLFLEGSYAIDWKVAGDCGPSISAAEAHAKVGELIGAFMATNVYGTQDAPSAINYLKTAVGYTMDVLAPISRPFGYSDFRKAFDELSAAEY